jgi:hypothetical protein
MVRRGRAARTPDTTRAYDGERRHFHAGGRPDSGDAFIADPGDGPARTRDDLAEALAEDFLRTATSGEYGGEPLGEVVPEELGGPFIETDARKEFADDVDESNPLDATAEALPQAVGGLAQPPAQESGTDPEEASLDEDDDEDEI